MESEKILMQLVRVGTVTAVNQAKRLARVKYEDSGIISGWLPVLKNQPAIPAPDVPQETEAASGGSGYAEFAAHKHKLIISPWMPAAGDKVVTLYLPVFNGDGFVIGGI